MEKSGLSQVLKNIPKDSLVLDVGCGGLYGENTTDFLLERFKPSRVDGICNNEKQIEIYYAQKEERGEPYVKDIVVEDFYKINIEQTYDLVVLDLNIENNVTKDWTQEGFDRVAKMLNPNGYILLYLMLPLEATIPQFDIDGFELIDWQNEVRRPHIIWFLFQKT